MLSMSHQRHFSSSCSVRMIWKIENYQWLIPTDTSKFHFHWMFFCTRSYFLQSFILKSSLPSLQVVIQLLHNFFRSCSFHWHTQCLHYQKHRIHNYPLQRSNIAGEQQMVSKSIFALKFVSIRCTDTCCVLVIVTHLTFATQCCASVDLAEPPGHFSFSLARTSFCFIEFTSAGFLVNLGFHPSGFLLFPYLMLPSYHPFNS